MRKGVQVVSCKKNKPKKMSPGDVRSSETDAATARLGRRGGFTVCLVSRLSSLRRRWLARIAATTAILSRPIAETCSRKSL